MAVVAVTAIRVVTALGAEQLVIDTAGGLSQWTWESRRYADVDLAGFATLAVFVVAALHAQELVVDATRNAIFTDDGLRFANAGDTRVAAFAVRVVTAFRANQLVIDATGNRTELAKNDVRLTEPVFTGGAFAAIAGFAALVTVDADDRYIRRRTGHTAGLPFRTNGNAPVHACVADFTWVFTEQRLARAVVAATLAGTAVFVPAAFLANAGAANQTSGTVGGAYTAIGRV
jgi:hypothetical protein